MIQWCDRLSNSSVDSERIAGFLEVGVVRIVVSRPERTASDKPPSRRFARVLTVPWTPSGLVQIGELAEENFRLPEASIVAVVESGGNKKSPGAGFRILVEVLSDDEPHGRVWQWSVVVGLC